MSRGFLLQPSSAYCHLSPFLYWWVCDISKNTRGSCFWDISSSYTSSYLIVEPRLHLLMPMSSQGKCFPCANSQCPLMGHSADKSTVTDWISKTKYFLTTGDSKPFGRKYTGLSTLQEYTQLITMKVFSPSSMVWNDQRPPPSSWHRYNKICLLFRLHIQSDIDSWWSQLAKPRLHVCGSYWRQRRHQGASVV